MEKNKTDLQYLELVRDVIGKGTWKKTRSGTVLSVFGRTLRFDMSDGFPILTTKNMFFRGIKEELLWFLTGNTNIKYLVDRDVHIWDDDAYRYYTELVSGNNEAIDSPELNNLYAGNIPFSKVTMLSKEEFLLKVRELPTSKESIKEMILLHNDKEARGFRMIQYAYGDLKRVYGEQWRNWDFRIDQIKNVIRTLKENPFDRRMLVTAWNPSDLDNMALPPCHYAFQLFARSLSLMERLDWLCEHSADGQYDEWKIPSDETLDKLNVPKYALSLMWQQRSVDVVLGLPFNISSYALLLSMIAQCVNMVPDELIGNLGDIHIYDNHLTGIREQLKRDTDKYKLPKLWLNPDIKDIDEFTSEDIKLFGYESYPSIKQALMVGQIQDYLLSH